jgi:hypothetical protein
MPQETVYHGHDSNCAFDAINNLNVGRKLRMTERSLRQGQAALVSQWQEPRCIASNLMPTAGLASSFAAAKTPLSDSAGIELQTTPRGHIASRSQNRTGSRLQVDPLPV